MINIYQNQERLKWIIISIALLIGTFSLWYTNVLVSQLVERELRQVALFAKGLSFLVTEGTNEETNFVLYEIVNVDNSIPLIWTDEKGNVQDYRNLDIPRKMREGEKKEAWLIEKIKQMSLEYDPIVIKIENNIVGYVYYSNSYLIPRLRYFAIIQLSVIAILSVLAYFVFSSTRRAEQNRVWVGLAKETAHQLGTPISSLLAWVEYLKTDPNFDQSILPEIGKDINRLEMITARFSSIGSQPQLKEMDVLAIVENITGYLQKRISSRVRINITAKVGHDMFAPLNGPLFEWVIENLCKNAVDAMGRSGKIDIYLKNSKDGRFLLIDVSDTGKGIPKSKHKAVFQPGFTTKKRGWGLGLTLVKRIVQNYNNGKIFVLKSEKGVGTTFRIMIPK